MKKNMFFIFTVGLALFSVQSALASPNFIIILLDDYGWSSLSQSMDKRFPAAKSDYYETPNINALMNMGMRFSNGYAASPVCAPTRYSLQFGKTPARIGITRGLGPNNAEHDQISIAELLKSINSSYRTAHIGKWHIDADPSQYGYDLHDGITKNAPGGFANNDSKRQWQGYAEDDPKRVDSLTERAIHFMEETISQKRPFFLQLSHYAVHSDIVYSQASFEITRKRPKGALHFDEGYAAMVEDLDHSIGVLAKSFQELGLATNTYIFLTSDNGGMPVLPQRQNLGKPYSAGLNSPLLRGKWDLTEGGIRVPFSISGPGIAKNSQTDTPVVTYDILPTVLDIAAGSTSELPKEIDGGSLWMLAEGKADLVERPYDFLVFHYPHYNRVGMNEPHSAIRYGDVKMIRFPVSGRRLVFDLENDSGEQNDLSDVRQDLTNLLDSKLTEYLNSIDAERPEHAFNWKTTGKSGRVRTKFFQRYGSE
tara:strand:- start:344 stop:1783 length:1440 start_codon:yes stop_codon:yes gene_type:complete